MSSRNSVGDWSRWHGFQNVAEQIVRGHTIGLRLEVQDEPMPHSGQDSLANVRLFNLTSARPGRSNFRCQREGLPGARRGAKSHIAINTRRREIAARVRCQHDVGHGGKERFGNADGTDRSLVRKDGVGVEHRLNGRLRRGGGPHEYLAEFLPP